MKDTEDVQRLIRLKRHETPGDLYFQHFAETFKDRQRAELLQKSSLSLLLERFSFWADDWGGIRLMVPAGAAAIILVVGAFFLLQQPGDSGVSNAPGGLLAESPVGHDSEESGEVIELTLPRTQVQVPRGVESARPSESTGLPQNPVLQTGAQGTLREL